MSTHSNQNLSSTSTPAFQSTRLGGIKRRRPSESPSGSDMGPPLQKRQKLREPLASLLARVSDEGFVITNNIRRILPVEYALNDPDFKLVARWMEHADMVRRAVEPALLKKYTERFPPPPSGRPEYEATCIQYKEALKKFVDRRPSLSPSSFAKGSVWVAYQEDEDNRVLCFRPANARGIALNLLHGVFQEFREIWLSQTRDPLEPDLSNAAESVVLQLISKMPQGFRPDSLLGKPEDQRERLFRRIIAPFLGSYSREYHLGTGSSSAKVDGAWIIEDSNIRPSHCLLALLELKAEIGSPGDPYMQLVRTYQLAVDELQSEDTRATRGILAEGAPMFLIGLVGTDFFVSGGFYDGKHTLVEHLAQLRLVDDGFGTVHKDNLARLFYALSKTMKSLSARMKQVLGAKEPPPTFNPLTPRLYNSWTLFSDDKSNSNVMFLEPLFPPTSRRHVFSAVLAGSRVFVKLVDVCYGVDVHQLLAEEQLAPQLLACAKPNHLPAAYAMEYLTDWQVLGTASASDLTEVMISCIRQKLKRVLDCLKENKMVHGDLRPANIMFKSMKEQQSVDICVVDFDWAGVVGRVTYPCGLNPDITWPGKSKYPIEQDHDLIMVNTWWPTQFPGSQFTSD